MPGRAVFDRGGKIRRMERKLDDPSSALRKVGVLMVGQSQRAFKEQRFGSDDWEPLPAWISWRQWPPRGKICLSHTRVANPTPMISSEG